MDALDTHKTKIKAREEAIRNSSAICLEKNQTDVQHVEQGTDLSAHHYGLASVSYPKLLKSLLGSSKRGNLTECGVLAAVLKDMVHPTKLGHLLLADILVLYLAKAQKYYQDNKVHLRHQGLTRQRVSPLFPQSALVPRMTCYGVAAFLIRRQGPDIDETASSHLPVSNFSDGWEFVEMEHGKYKPGWISNTSGSVLRITVDVENSSPGVRQTIGLSFLISYEHMGTANLSCVQGCQCSDRLMDGHERVHRHSVPQMTTIEPKWPASAISTNNASKRSCELQVEVLNKTYSGGYKFKVLQLVVTT